MITRAPMDVVLIVAIIQPTHIALTGHSTILRTRTCDWPDERSCEDAARAMASCPAIRHATITLEGPLGAGKTTFARALLRALGVKGRIKSPTFSVVEPYEGQGFSIAHLDLYRLNDAQAFESSGLRDTIAAEGLKVVEWPSRAGNLLPTPDLHLDLQVLDEDGRRATITAYSAAGIALLEASGKA